MEPSDMLAVRLLVEELERSDKVHSALTGHKGGYSNSNFLVAPMENGNILIGFHGGSFLHDEERNPIEFNSFAEAIDALRADVIMSRSSAISEYQEKLRKAVEAHNANGE